MSYGYNFNYNFGASDFSFAEFMSVMAVMYAVIGVFALTLYVLQAVAMMRIAKGRGFSKPWFAFIPFANDYLFGKVADDICYRNGKKKGYRKLLPALSIAGYTVMGVGIAMTLSKILGIFINWDINFDRYGNFIGIPPTSAELAVILAGVFVIMIAAILLLIYLVFDYIALYQIYKDYAPKEAVLFLIFSILVSGLFTVIALLIIKNRTPQSIAAPAGRWEDGYFVFNPPAAPGYGYGAQNAAGQPVVGFDPYNQPYAGGFNQPPVPPAAPQQPGQGGYQQPQPPVPPQEPTAPDQQ